MTRRTAEKRKELFLKPTKLRPRAVPRYSALFAGSVCAVESIPTGLIIEFGGALSNPPNKSNDHTIMRGRIRRGDKTHAASAAMRDLYIGALIDKGIMPPSFGDTPVHIWIYLPKSASRQDSHNTPKAIGDWLESVGVIDNDKQAQIWALRKSDYSAFKSDLDTLRIEVQPLSRINRLLEEVLLESRQVLRGLELIG